MELKVKIADLNKPNLNNIIYTEECFSSIKNQIAENVIPVRLITNDFWKDFAGNVMPIGSAKLDRLSVYPELHFTIDVVDPYVKECIEKGLGAFGLCDMSEQVVQDNVELGENI